MSLTLLADILATCPDAYVQAQRESNERHNSDDRSPALDASGPAADDERRSGEEPDGGDSGSAEPAAEDRAAPDFPGLIDDAFIRDAQARIRETYGPQDSGGGRS